MGIHPIILCGGPGSRLWPASTQGQPKPFIDLLGGLSLFQRTALRMAAIPNAHQPVVVTGLDHAEIARAQLNAVGLEGAIVVEPIGRDSGPALLSAAVWLALTDPSAVAVAVASDHHIPDDAAFIAGVIEAVPAVAAGRIVTFGVRPNSPSTSYGYIRPAEPLTQMPKIFRAAQFVEKPDLARAERLVAEGCLWNSGNFMFRVDTLLDEALRLAPTVLECVRDAVSGGVRRHDGFNLGAGFEAAPRVSIDVAVMEKTDRAAVLPIDYEWSDLGAWNSVWSASEKNEDGNTIGGEVSITASENCLVRASTGSRVVVMGLRDIAVVARGGDVLVASMGLVGDLKPALASLRDQHAPKATERASPKPFDSAGRLKAWLWQQALPLWWCFGADHTDGGFHERLAQDLKPILLNRRARVQARQVYVYASAGLMGWPGPWETALEHGLTYLYERYRRSDGLFVGSVDPRGSQVDDTAFLYDQCFVLLALATAAKASSSLRVELTERAETLASAIRRTFASEGSGYKADDRSSTYLADPIMHLFEAVLALIDVADKQQWRIWAREIAELFMGRMYNRADGFVPEVFDEQWRAKPGLEGRTIEPGHQFEWAWLMERWYRLYGDQRAREIAVRLFAAGERGVDPASGLVLDAVLDDFTPLEPTSRFWPQTERLKAALLFASGKEGANGRYSQAASSAMLAMDRYLSTPTVGLWRDSPSGVAPSPAPPTLASTFYHIFGAIEALDRGAAEELREQWADRNHQAVDVA